MSFSTSSVRISSRTGIGSRTRRMLPPTVTHIRGGGNDMEEAVRIMGACTFRHGRIARTREIRAPVLPGNRRI
jgi:hypothetical protein